MGAGAPAGKGAADFSAERFLGKAVIFAYGFFLLFLFRNDAARYFVRGGYQFITAAGALLLIAASVAYASRGAGGRGRPARRALLCLFLLAPIVWSFAAPVEVHELSGDGHGHEIAFAGMAGGRDAKALTRPGPGDVTLKFPPPAGSVKMEERTYTPINLLELGILLEKGASDYDGARVAVRGQAARGGAPGEFILSRLTSGWCVVHAAEHAEAVSMTVNYPESGNLKRDAWVTVYGVLRERHDAPGGRGRQYMILAEKVTPTPAPAEPIMLKWSVGKPFYF